MAQIFVDTPSNVAPPPFFFANTTSVTFRLKAKGDKLEQVTDRLVNDHIGDKTKHLFTPNKIWPEVHVTFNRFPQAASSAKSLGTLAYQEVVFSFPIYNLKNPYEAHQLCTYLFIDGPESGKEEYFAWSPIATGRELYGLPKVRGEITFEPKNLTGECFGLLPGALGRIEPQSIIRIEQSKTDSLKGLQGSVDDLLCGRNLSRAREVLSAAERRVAEHLPEPDRSPEERLKQLLRFIWGNEDSLRSIWGELIGDEEIDYFALNAAHKAGLSTGLMGLRQLHDARTSNHKEAVHREVISAKFTFSKLHQSPVQDFSIQIDNADVRQRLGLDKNYDPVDGGTEVHVVSNADAVFAKSGDVVVLP